MTVTDAIERLRELKKLEEAGFGRCELTGLDESSITVRFSSETQGAPVRKPVLGFAEANVEEPPRHNRKRKEKNA